MVVKEDFMSSQKPLAEMTCFFFNRNRSSDTRSYGFGDKLLSLKKYLQVVSVMAGIRL